MKHISLRPGDVAVASWAETSGLSSSIRLSASMELLSLQGGNSAVIRRGDPVLVIRPLDLVTDIMTREGLEVRIATSLLRHVIEA